MPTQPPEDFDKGVPIDEDSNPEENFDPEKELKRLLQTAQIYKASAENAVKEIPTLTRETKNWENAVVNPMLSSILKMSKSEMKDRLSASKQALGIRLETLISNRSACESLLLQAELHSRVGTNHPELLQIKEIFQELDHLCIEYLPGAFVGAPKPFGLENT